MVLGLAVNEAVGASIGGGGTGVGGATGFLLQALTARTTVSARTTFRHWLAVGINSSSIHIARAPASSSQEGRSVLLPAPCKDYLKLQLGCVFSPPAVNCRSSLPSASML